MSGRLVWEDRIAARAGENSFPWDGRDRAGDRVANGVYLLQLTLRGEGARLPMDPPGRLVDGRPPMEGPRLGAARPPRADCAILGTSR